MNLWMDALAWLGSAEAWTAPGGIIDRLVQHVLVSLLSVALAGLVVIPVGMYLGHRRHEGTWIWLLTAAARSVPTIGLLTLLALLLGIGVVAPLLALTVLAVPSLLAASYSAIFDSDYTVVDAMRGNGMSEFALLIQVELPAAAPVMIGGIRNALLQVCSTATLAAYTADIGLGRFIFAGLKSSNYGLMLGGALLVTALTFLLDLLAGWFQHRSARLANPQ